MRRYMTFLIILAGVLSFSLTDAALTRIVVRAKSKDAKFIGTSMGGAHVVIKDSETGEVLAEGLTSGGTGNSKKIMIEPKTRFGRITDASTAKFIAPGKRSFVPKIEDFCIRFTQWGGDV